MSGALALLLTGGGRLAAALLALLLGLLPRPEGGPLPDPSPAPIASLKPAEPALASAAVDALALVPRAPPESGLAASSFSPPSWPAPADGSLLVLTARGSALLVLARGCAPESLSRAGELVGQKCGGTEAGSNWYAYCDNDPVNRADPSGLDWQWVAGAWNYVQGTDPFVPYPLFTPGANGDQLYNVTYVNAGTYRRIRDAYCQRGFEKDLNASAQDFITAPLRIIGAGAVPTYASQLGP